MIHAMSLPEDLKRKATTIAGELAWPVAVASEIVERMRQLDLAVVGLEIWLREGDNPRVIGFSDYRRDFQGDWPSFVEENAVEALRALRNPIPENAFINLTWLTVADVTTKKTVE